MLEIGKALRSARERQGLECAELERRTHIRTRYLEALEDERLDVIPGRAYAKGFLRTYADALGLDGQRLVDEFNERYQEVDPAALEPPALEPVGRTRHNRRLAAAAIAAAVVAVVGGLAWGLGGHHRGAAVPPSPAAAKAAPAAAPARPRAVPKATPEATAHLVLRASGPCWVSVHVGTATGATLYQGTLAAGGSLRYTLAPGRPVIWLRVGAPWSLTVALNGKQGGRLLSAPGNLVATRSGLRTT